MWYTVENLVRFFFRQKKKGSSNFLRSFTEKQGDFFYFDLGFTARQDYFTHFDINR